MGRNEYTYVKLAYVLNREHRLTCIRPLKGKNWSDGFECELHPLTVDIDHERIFDEKLAKDGFGSVTFEANVLNSDLQYAPGIWNPEVDLKVLVVFGPGELNQSQIDELKVEFILSYPLQCIHQVV